MQKNTRRQTAAQNRGFYIILTVCAIAIAISGYVLFFAPISNEASMDSVEYVPDLPQTTWEPKEDVLQDPIDNLLDDDESLQTSLQDGSLDDTLDTSLETSSEVTEPTVNQTDETTTSTVSEEPEETEQTASTTPVWVRPTDGEVSQAFSGTKLIYQETFGDWRVHAGTDYAGNAGDHVYAVQNGEVTDVSNDSLWGCSVTIKLSDNRTAIYRGLNEDAKVKTGSKVSAGDVIGTIAELVPAEASQSAHLHFELLDADGVPVDPEA